MKNNRWFAVCAICLLALACAPALCGAQSPFDGTWHINVTQAKFSPKPHVFYISDGWYHCGSCAPDYVVQADGKDHAVSGHAFDTVAVTIVDPKTITIAVKKDGKVISEQTRTVSANRKMLTVKTTVHPMNSDKPVTDVVTAKMVGVAPLGVHDTSGSWQIQKVTESENGTTVTYKTSGDEFSMSDPTGASYTAKLDGQDYPVKGAYGYDTVSLKKIDAHTIEETDKRAGKVTDVTRMTVSANGKTMTIADTSQPDGRVATFTATKK
jgi:hypothetical protein